MSEVPEGPGAPTPPLPLAGGAAAAGTRLRSARVEPDAGFRARLAALCPVRDDPATLAEAGRDWWPLAACWAAVGEVPTRPALVARPRATAEVVAAVKLCHEAGVPLTVSAGRSGVCGGSLPVHGGVALDLCALEGIVAVDDASLLVRVRPGSFGDRFEAELRERHGLTCGHWPQSLVLSTVGGWVACRGAGQLSTRYGKIEDMTAGLEVVCADGRVIHTGGHPRAACGPDLTQLFVGSEGTLGVITEVLLRVHPAPTAERRAAHVFESFEAGLDACRRMLRRGARPAVLRLYDARETRRHKFAASGCALLVLDEGDPALVEATLAIVAEAVGAAPRSPAIPSGTGWHTASRWRLFASWAGSGVVGDTFEIAAPWSALPGIYATTCAALQALPGTLAVSAHQSHAYPDGACLYFSFAGRPEGGDVDAWYRTAFDTAARAVLRGGGALSHHHGIGLLRSHLLAEALGPAHELLVALKGALDPKGILNPGKLGLPSPFGAPAWP